MFFFFFKAEDGIRVLTVTGVQTCALPISGRAAAFWHPLRTLAAARTPVRLWVDRATVRRGDSVTVTVLIPAAARATLETRGPGEPWRAASLTLDSVGRAVRRIGPLEADLFLRASGGGRPSAEGGGGSRPAAAR